MGKKAKAAGKPVAKAGAKAASAAKRRRTAGPPPELPAAFARPPLTEVLAGPLRFLLVDVGEGPGGANGADFWLHGVTAGGHSVAALARGFLPYFFCHCPPEACSEEALRTALEASLEGDRAAAGAAVGGRLVVAVERVRRRPLIYYHPEKADFWQIFLASPRLVVPAGSRVEKGLRLARGEGVDPLEFRSPTFEANVPSALRFMVDSGLVGGGWAELAAGSFVRTEVNAQRTRAQVEVEVPWKSIAARAPEGDFLALAPLRLLTVSARADDQGRVACVAVELALHGHASPPLGCAAWALAGTMTDAVGSQSAFELSLHEDEGELLQHFAAFLAHCDPDAIVGYELGGCLALLLDRAQAAKADIAARQLGRIVGVESKVKNGVVPGTQETRKEVNAEGRLVIDIAPLVARDHKLTSYTLAAVVQHFLGSPHFELAASEVASLLTTRPDHLARHVLRDAGAGVRLLEHLCLGYNLIEMARVTGVPVDYLLTRGQMVKVTSQLLRKAREHDFVLPGRGAGNGDTYEGGFVMDPQTGLYDDPIVVLDFASLYPSVMIARNLCYTTLLPERGEKTLSLEESSFEKSPATSETGQPYLFVNKSLRKGLLPQILEELLAARKDAKLAMKEAEDPTARAVLNGRQLALKISANSVYGFTGATVGNLPCLEIAASVTAYGREMIQTTGAFIGDNCEGARVIYGDTDSVMLSFGAVAREDAVRRGKEAAARASANFPAPIKLEFEKVLQPFLLLNKKRYAGLPWDGDKALALDMKGIETVRRDWCGLVRQVVDRSLALLLKHDRCIDEARDYVRGVVASLRRGDVDLRLLTISKSLGKKGEADYVAKAAHVELAEKLRKRDPKTAPRYGERVHYVIIAGVAGAKVWERAEDPCYAQAQGLPIDADYYIEQQLKAPLLRVFEPVLGGSGADPAKAASMLFANGEGRRAAAPAAGAGAKKGGLGSFIKRSEKCLSCSAAVPGSEPFCKNCAGTEKAEAATTSKVAGGRACRTRRAALLTTCQGCVGPELGDAHLRCANVGCDIFFERARVAQSVAEAEAAFARLKVEW